MSTSSNQKPELPSTYFVADRANQDEMQRLQIQDQLLTASMGGVLQEQPDPSAFRRVLDVGCGTGRWLIDTAKAYPRISRLVGVDVSLALVEYARAQAEAEQVKGRTEFHVMDALHMLEFPTSFFDLVNMRLGSSFMRTWDWPKMLTEMGRVARIPGVVRVTDLEVGAVSTSPALTQLYARVRCALYRAGHLFTDAPDGLTSHLERLLTLWGYPRVQTKSYAREYWAGTPAGEVCYQDAKHFFQTLRPFIQKWDCAGPNYDSLYQQMLQEMHQPDFHGTWKLLTAWGTRPADN
ncbi:MAG TPA: methyltransferase domain-containing protein [Ktedonobacteraceae bacterium]|jgi:ubiquinone/menaquinone biosynthesis C-methylase UbiE|nr:methyltransferase domain-containing protein [Ktedonobacteraceae bacterium]